MKRTQRWISLILCMALVLSMIPLNVFAEQNVLLTNQTLDVSVDEVLETDAIDVAPEIDEVVDLLSLTEPVSGYCGGEGDGTNLTWKLTTDGVLTISGAGAMKNFAMYASDSPWDSYTDYISIIILEEGVTSIGDYAFSYCGYAT